MMLMTCLHLKPLAIQPVASFSMHIAGGARRRLATAAPPRDQFPYPLHPRPTPYQIFHLPRGASQKQVKTRCKFFRPRLRSLFRRLTFSNVVCRKTTNSFGCTTQILLTAEPQTFQHGYETRGSARSRTPMTFSLERVQVTLLDGTVPIPTGIGN